MESIVTRGRYSRGRFFTIFHLGAGVWCTFQAAGSGLAAKIRELCAFFKIQDSISIQSKGKQHYYSITRRVCWRQKV